MGHARPDQQPTVAAPTDGQFARVGVFVVDEPLSRGDEVVEDVLLGQFHTALVPSLAVFPAAAEVGHGVHAAHLHPHQIGDAERWRQRDVEPAVAVQQSRIVAVEHHTLLVGDEHRDARAVLAVVEHLSRHVLSAVKINLRLAK